MKPVWLSILGMIATVNVLARVAVNGGPYRGGTQNHLDSVQVDSLAKKVVLAYSAYQDLQSVHSALNRVSTEEESLSEYRTMIHSVNQLVCVPYNDYNFWDSSFTVIFCKRWDVMHIGNYMLAMGYDGTLFYLSGFGQNDFKNLLHYKIGPIDSEGKAEQVAKLYMSTVQFDPRARFQFVDSTLARMYSSEFPYLSPPRIRLQRDTYTVTLYTFYVEYERVELHQVALRETGDKQYTFFDHSVVIMNEGTLTDY